MIFFEVRLLVGLPLQNKFLTYITKAKCDSEALTRELFTYHLTHLRKQVSGLGVVFAARSGMTQMP